MAATPNQRSGGGPDPNAPIMFFGVEGRDGSSPPFKVPNNRCSEALNVDWYQSSLGRKRGGSTSVSLSGGTAQTGVVSFLKSHVPADNQSNRELWSIDDAATPRWKRLAGGTSWADVTVTDAIAATPWTTDAISFNGKLVFAYDSTVNRLHCWDPTDNAVRRMGLPKSAAPSVANTGAGAYAAVIRYYKVRFVKQVASINVIEGEFSDATTFTPSGAGTAARVSRPTVPSEVETHWQIAGSPDNANFFIIATVAIATSTYDDSGTPSTYTGNVIPDTGSRICAPSAKYLSAESTRIIMAGAYETAAGNGMAPKNNRLWWTAPLGATDNGDDERVSNTSTIKNYADIEEAVTGISLPFNGYVYAFSFDGQWKMVPTGLASAPYLVLRVAGGMGCVSHKSIVVAEDENGEPALYWWGTVGPYRRTMRGQQSMHEDVDDIRRSVNLSAGKVICHAVWHKEINQIWWYLATGSSDEPDTKVVFDTNLGRIVERETIVRGGWSKHNGPSAAARCSAMMSDTLGATMSRTLKPYVGRSTGTAIWKTDTADLDDAGTAYQGYVESRLFTPWGFGMKGSFPEEGVMAARAASGVTITIQVLKDLNTDVVATATAVLTPTAQETNATSVYRKFEALRGSELSGVKIRVGDAAAVANSWNLDIVRIPWTVAGAIGGNT